MMAPKMVGFGFFGYLLLGRDETMDEEKFYFCVYFCFVVRVGTYDSANSCLWIWVQVYGTLQIQILKSDMWDPESCLN